MNSYHLIAQVGVLFQLIIIIAAADPTPVKQKCQCGVTIISFRSLRQFVDHTDLKIVNGQVMKNTQHPHLALLMVWSASKKKYLHVCGGTIINNKYVLTAAHCFGHTKRELLGVKKSDWQVRLGVHNKFISSQGSYFSVSDIITHKKYRKVGDGGGLDNDIALLKLNDTIYFTDKIRPACLPSAGSNNYSMGTVQGWGKTESGFGSSQARQAKLHILSDKDCRESNIAPTMGDPETKICAEDFTADACQGDSGGPLFVENADSFKTMVLGIISSGKSCADFNYPGVYTKVERFLPWIQENTRDAQYCD